MEADVRAAYSKFFDIPFDASEYIDLYTPQVLFEFKYDKNLSRNHEKARVLAQALYYVRRLRYGDIDELKAKEESTLFSQDLKGLHVKKQIFARVRAKARQSPMVSDAFHVYPTDCKADNNRSSYLYAVPLPPFSCIVCFRRLRCTGR